VHVDAKLEFPMMFSSRRSRSLRCALQRTIGNGIQPGLVLADQPYGTSREFRKGVREMGLHYAAAVDNRTVVMVFDKLGRRREEIIGVLDLALRIDTQGGFRRCTWRQGTKQDLSARFALRRVVPAYDGGHGVEKREPVWLLIEWRDGEVEPANCSSAPSLGA
jgi:hypothetical protein